MPFGRRIAELSFVNGGANQVVGECRHPPRGPERIVGAQLHVSGRRRLRLPCPRIEAIAFEPSDRRVLDIRDGVPRAQRKAERQQPPCRGVAVVEVFPAHVPDAGVVRHSEAGADVLQIVADH